MLNDPATLDRVGTMLAGVAGTAALAATAPVSGIAAVAAGAGILQIVCAGRGSVIDRLSKRRSDAAQMLDAYLAAYRENWREWSGVASLTDEGDAENAILNFEEYFATASADVLPPPERIMGLGRDVDALVAELLDHAAARAPERYGAHPGNDLSRDFFRRVTSGGLSALLQNPDFAYLLMPAFQDQVLGRFDTLEAHVTEILRRLPEQPADSGVSARALIRLARRIAEDVEDPEHAFVELSRAVEIAERVQAEGRAGSNLGDFVDEVLRRVAELSAASDNDAAAAEIDAALAREEAESRARQKRLLDAGLEQDILRRDPDSAGRRLARKAELKLPEGGKLFAALRAAQIAWHDSGRDKGLNFDLEVASALARVTHERAHDSDERGTSLNDLGNALWTLGEREAGTERLEQAVDAFRLALQERTRERVPLDWAMTQMNLGNALATLGKREAGTARLEEAVAAYRLALEEWTRERVPLDWAMTQMNLGTALATLGMREAGTEQLEKAVAAYRLALEERTRERVPFDWAMVQSNLCILKITFFDKTGDPAHLDAAERYLAAAREVFEEAGATQYLAQADAGAAAIAARRGG